MRKRVLGRTGLEVSPIAIGGAAFAYIHSSKGWDPMSDGGKQVVYSTVNRALDLGINYVDTAPAYGNGYSETLVGEVMRTRRDECVLASKVWYELDYAGVVDSVHQSLERLQTDHIDIMQVHGRMYTPEEVQHILHGGPLDALLELRDSGVGDARPVAQQRTDRWTQRLPPAPRSFLFHTAIHIDRQRIAGAAVHRGISPPMLPGQLFRSRLYAQSRPLPVAGQR